MKVFDAYMGDSTSIVKEFGFRGKERKVLEEVVVRDRMELMRAKRFALDDDFVRLATRVSFSTSPEKLLARLGSALLPYSSTWMELNPRVKVEEMEAMGGTRTDIRKIPDGLGIHLKRHKDRPSAWTCSLYSKVVIADHKDVPNIDYTNLDQSKLFVCPHPVAFLFDAEESNFDESYFRSWRNMFDTMNLYPKNQDTNKAISDDLNALCWGYLSEKSVKEYSGDKAGVLSDQTPSFLRRHACVSIQNFHSWCLANIRLTHGEKDVGNWINQFSSDLYSNTGMVRWIVTVLCMLNDCAIRTEEVRPTRMVRRPSGTYGKAADFTTVTLIIPRVKNQVRYIARKISGGGGRKKRHEVSSHWRTYLPEKPCEIDESFVPPVRLHAWVHGEEDHTYRKCDKCGAFSRMVKEHERGDASLGWVRKEYIVKARDSHDHQ